MYRLEVIDDGFRVWEDELILIEHKASAPAVYLGRGQETFHEYRGNFRVEDYTLERISLPYFLIQDNQILFFRHQKDMEPLLMMTLKEEELALGANPSCDKTGLAISLVATDASMNRFWIRLTSDGEERVYGLGEQMSYFNLKGRMYPILTSEPGVGRDKTTLTTFWADKKDKAGGDYYNTNYPEPTFVSSRNYWCHVDTTLYGVADFRNDNFHELSFFGIPPKLIFKVNQSLEATVKSLVDFAGKLPPLPDWVHDGIILGVQGGSQLVDGYLNQALDAGVQVSGLFVQDWQGINMTSFGQRLRWNWIWDQERYPGLSGRIGDYEKIGVKFLGYINPNVVKDGSLYLEAKEKDYLALDANGQVYDLDYGEFDCGIVDLTNPSAFKWFKEVIKKNLIDFGLKGWMADFGEYLPMDCQLYNGVSAKEMHNAWPALWARCNYEAVEEAGLLGEILYFMRAGGFGSQKYCVSLWAGDQSVDWSRHDGMATVISGALSSGMVGNPYHHSDIGGYTSLHGNIRSKELFERWLEMGTFSSLMRTHEGNRPRENFQFYQDQDTLRLMAKLTKLRKALKPYIKAVNLEASCEGSGLPMQRPLVLHYPTDPETYSLQDEYLLGRDLLVAPVMVEGGNSRDVYLPQDQWIHLWSGVEYGKGHHQIQAQVGYIPVFYRKDSTYKALFDRLVAEFKNTL